MEKLVSDNIDVKNVKNEFEPLQITGRGIVCGYLQLEPESVAKYLQIQEALKTFENWSESSRINFLEQKIHWYDVPLCIRNRFVEFLTTLGIFQINHIEDVFTSFVTHLLPISRKESCIDPQEQQILYNMAHDSIKRVISCNKLSNRILVKYCTRLFPHVRQPADKMLAFVCNLIKLAEETDDEDTKIEIWSLLVDRLLQLDAATTDSHDEESRLSFCNNSNELYSPNNCLSSDSEAIIDPISEEKLENPMETKLDQFVALILLFIGTRSGKSTEEMLKQIISKESDKNFEMLSLFLVKNNEEIMINKENNLKRGKTANNNISPIFQLFLEGFDEHVLTATGVHSTPFVWFYLCSLSKKNCQKMLEFLWEIILLPPNLRGDRRKSQNAATFLCGFLARANYIDFEFACSWLKNLSTWCLDYITKNSKNEVVKRNISPNIKITQHGIFFSIVQALLFVFCYRHEELNKKENALKEVYSWNLDKIVFNSLNPLQHISKGKSTDNLPLLSNKTSLTNDLLLKHRKAVIDLFFPFSFCSLKICSPLLLPLMRRFSSLERHYRNVVIDEDIEEEEEENEELICCEYIIEDNKRENNNNILQIDEGYEEELMCLKSVNEFNNYNIMYEGNNEEQQQMEI